MKNPGPVTRSLRGRSGRETVRPEDKARMPSEMRWGLPRTDSPGGMVFAGVSEAIRAPDKAVGPLLRRRLTRRPAEDRAYRSAEAVCSFEGGKRPEYTPTVFQFQKYPMPELTEPILLALSHKPSANLLEDRLSRKGATVIRVHEGQEALRWIQKSAFGVVVAETGLPGRTGLELLRSVPPLRPPFVLMGRRGNDENMTRAFEMSAFDYFTRPFAPRVAAARILRVPRLLSTATEARVPVPK